MLLPTVFRSVEEDYQHLKSTVQVWDVDCERQVDLRGPDAGRLMQMLTPRDLGSMLPGQCYYIPMVDESGGMLNDPVAVKLAKDRWWISIADSDLLLWVKGLVYDFRLDVLVDEPDVSPLAVQGPRADEPMAAVLGDVVQAVRFFRFGMFEFMGRASVVARSGYSQQGGFDIYLEGSDLGMPLWNALLEAGASMDVRAGCPNGIERVESGLLSYGTARHDGQQHPARMRARSVLQFTDRNRLHRTRCALAGRQGGPGAANPSTRHIRSTSAAMDGRLAAARR